jgi:hypothetical protein
MTASMNVDLAVLGAVADDYETIEMISLDRSPDEIFLALTRLVEAEFVGAYIYCNDANAFKVAPVVDEECWFLATSLGRVELERSLGESR